MLRPSRDRRVPLCTRLFCRTDSQQRTRAANFATHMLCAPPTLLHTEPGTGLKRTMSMVLSVRCWKRMSIWQMAVCTTCEARKRGFEAKTTQQTVSKQREDRRSVSEEGSASAPAKSNIGAYARHSPLLHAHADNQPNSVPHSCDSCSTYL